MKHLTVGAGEVGRAVHEVIGGAIRDVDPIDADADVLHVCFPWSDHDTFVQEVDAYQDEHGADLVVVHSTVPVGTCDRNAWVHSPIRGKHPYLVEGIRTFVKHFGGRRAPEAAVLFAAAGVSTQVHDRARDTEAGKLWELAQYGIQIQVEKAIHAWCAEHDVDFDVAYTAFAHTYNEGWAEMGDVRYVRPVLEHVDGPIGGHCVVPCSALLDHPVARIVAEGL